MTESGKVRKVRALYNPKSGLGMNSAETVRAALQETWDVPGIDLTYQVSKSAEDGIAKTRRAVEDGVDTVIVIGGDGMVNTIGSALVGTDTALAVLPAGSGNGFARHFDIPLQLEKASKLLFEGSVNILMSALSMTAPFLSPVVWRGMQIWLSPLKNPLYVGCYPMCLLGFTNGSVTSLRSSTWMWTESN